jgi:CRISPR-associated protein Csm4
MKFTVIKLKPKGPFHIGERENWREGSKIYIPSDTIFSALCHSFLLLYGELNSLLKDFISGNPPFLISSAFPYWQNQYFFPVPKNQFPKDKDLKKISFIELEGLQELLLGERIEKINGNFKTLPPFPWIVEDTPRISLSRWTNHPGENFFHFGQVIFNNDAGLFLLVDFKNNGLKKKVFASFNLLVHEGIGGDRSSGKGLFYKPEILEIEIKTISNYDGFYSLSMYHPLVTEISGIEKGFYEIEERKGYIFSPYGQSLRRRSVRMFTEGSIFPADKMRLGNLIDITPEVYKTHKVYRYGYVLSIPCRLEVL